MPLTYILVDFENVQPNAVDIALVGGDSVRLAIFRGPGQMKYAADLAEAWQPLGANLTFIRCAKAGRNAVDMHIAFYLGELIAAQARSAAQATAVRFVVVSRDTDFDPLLLHIRSLGFEAQRVATIRAAFGTQVTAPAPARSAAAKKSPAKKAAAKKAPVTKAPAATKTTPASKPAPARRTAAKSPAKKSAEAPKDIVLTSLQSLGERRPSKRNALERHIESHLGRKVEMDAVRALVADMERDGWLKIVDNKVDYALPKSRK